MSIKVSGVSGDNLTPGESTQDFVLNSHPVMMVGGTKRFLELLQAVEAGGGKEALFFVTHPHAAAVALASRHHATSHLEIPYWSTTPYLFGPGRAVKYSARPTSTRTTPLPDPLTDNYLQERLTAHLAREEARFDFLVQFQTDSRKMPIEDASVEWRREGLAVPVASLTSAFRCKQSAAPRARRPANRCRSIPGTHGPNIVRSATSTALDVRSTARWRRSVAIVNRERPGTIATTIVAAVSRACAAARLGEGGTDLSRVAVRSVVAGAGSSVYFGRIPCA